MSPDVIAFNPLLFKVQQEPLDPDTYDLLDSQLNLKRAITIHDFAKDLQHWAR